MNKKGLSAIVGTLLVVLLTIAAVGIVWAVLRGTIQSNTDQIDFSKFTLSMDIVAAQYDSDTGASSVTVQRNAGDGNLYGLSFIFSNATENNVVERIVTLDQLDKQTFTFSSDEIGLTGPTEISIAPLSLSSSNEQITGSISDTVKFISGSVTSPAGSGGITGDAVCGNNIIESGESCELGIDGIAGNEDDSLNGQTCITQSFESGSLYCSPDCTTYNTDSCSSLCTPDNSKDCSLQQGVCLGATQTCTAEGAWPGCDYAVYNASYELTEASCSDGFDNDCDGLIDLADTTCNLLLSGGIVDSVWPGSAPLYFDSLNLPNTTTELNTLVSKYINLSSDNVNCYPIYSAAHVTNTDTGYNMSNLQMGSVALNIAPGDIFSIWKTEDSCLAGV